MKWKSNKKSSFNKYRDCGTIGSVYRVKRRIGKISLLCIMVLMLSFFVCYQGNDSIEPEMEAKVKSLLISQLQLKSVDSLMTQIRNTAISNEEQQSVAVEEEAQIMTVSDNVVYDKIAYLTFDDGPSSNTDEILDILKEYNVKGTFFTVGRTGDSYERLYQRIVNEGHVLGMHSYSHEYSKIYSSTDAFMADLWQIQFYIYNTTGYMPTIYRFPGGSSNRVAKLSMYEFIDILNSNGIQYYDWNVSCMDANDYMLSKEQIINNVFNGIDNLEDPAERDEVMILFHDLPEKISTVDALPEIIEELELLGYEILPVNKNTKAIQHQNVR